MPSVHDVAYSVPFSGLPEFIQRGTANTLRCPVERDGALVAPSAGTVSIYDKAGTAQVNADAIDSPVVGSVATYSWNPSSSLPLGDGWKIVWTLTLAGMTHTFDNEAALVLRRLYCPIRDADLYRLHPILDPAADGTLTDQTSYQTQIDEAWLQIEGRLLAAGNRPNLIIGATALRESALHLTLAIIFESMVTGLPAAYADQGKNHRERFEAAWGRVALNYDPGDTGEVSQTRKRPVRPPSFLGTSRGR